MRHLVTQLAGLAAVLAGLYMLAGLGWALLACGVAVLVVSTLDELVDTHARVTAAKGGKG